MLKVLNVIFNIFRGIREFIVSLVFILFVLMCFSIGSLLGGEEQKPQMQFERGALLLNLNGYLADNRDEYSEFYRLLSAELGEEEPQKIATFDVARAIAAAKYDDQITGLVLDLSNLSSVDFSSLEYLGNEITDFKSSGKPVVAIGNYYSQTQYYLASFADEIYLNPAGFVGLQGLNYSNLYFKALLDKMDAVPHIFRVGTYKSAVEPLIRNNMSPEARQNAELWVNQVWRNFTQTIAENRDIAPEQVLPKMDRYLELFQKAQGDEAQYALAQKLVTKLTSRGEMEQALIREFGENDKGKFNHIDFIDYADTLRDRFSDEGNHKIAVVNVEGEIVMGSSDEYSAGSKSISRALRKAREDKNVEAVILRVNSPGGSAMASELIRQEVADIQQAGKPVITSMGGMAASGGYWIAATSDKIIASPSTITGSIGIFGLAVTFEKTAKNLGIQEDGISTSPLAESSALKSLNPEYGKLLQMNVENGYRQFLNLVAKGRKMTTAEVDKIAQGQVWTGEKAKALGLVDELGDFNLAYHTAVEMVNAKRVKQGKTEVDSFKTQWFTDEDDSLFGGIMQKFSSHAQVKFTRWLDLPVAQKLKREVDILTRFNDPQNRYLYCLNCGTLN